MSSIFDRLTRIFRRFVHTPDYTRDEKARARFVINPDVSGVTGVDQKYWKVVGDEVVVMDGAERDVVDGNIARGWWYTCVPWRGPGEGEEVQIRRACGETTTAFYTRGKWMSDWGNYDDVVAWAPLLEWSEGDAETKDRDD